MTKFDYFLDAPCWVLSTDKDDTKPVTNTNPGRCLPIIFLKSCGMVKV